MLATLEAVMVCVGLWLLAGRRPALPPDPPPLPAVTLCQLHACTILV